MAGLVNLIRLRVIWVSWSSPMGRILGVLRRNNKWDPDWGREFSFMLQCCPIGQANNWKRIGGRGSQCKLFLPKQLCLSWLLRAVIKHKILWLSTWIFSHCDMTLLSTNVLDHIQSHPGTLVACGCRFDTLEIFTLQTSLEEVSPIPLHLRVKPQSTVRPINNHCIRAETVSGEGCGSLTHQGT